MTTPNLVGKYYGILFNIWLILSTGILISNGEENVTSGPNITSPNPNVNVTSGPNITSPIMIAPNVNVTSGPNITSPNPNVTVISGPNITSPNPNVTVISGPNVTLISGPNITSPIMITPNVTVISGPNITSSNPNNQKLNRNKTQAKISETPTSDQVGSVSSQKSIFGDFYDKIIIGAILGLIGLVYEIIKIKYENKQKAKTEKLREEEQNKLLEKLERRQRELSSQDQKKKNL